MQGFNFWQFMAGIAVFVYAMSLIESSLKNLAGRTFKIYLQKQSQHKIKMLAASTVVTALLQSSSIVLLMVLSFVGTGLITMRSALAAVLGSNLGTTLYSWVIALFGFKIDFSVVSYPFLAVALVGMLLFKKNSRLFHATTFLIGFALVFVGLEWLKGCADHSLDTWFEKFRQWHYLFFIPVGFLITALVQSSSVTVAIALTALYNQLIPFESAAAIVIGSELGTSLKFLIGSASGTTDKKRVAWGNFLLNFVTMVMAAILLRPLVFLIESVLLIHDQLIGLVCFQTGTNLLSILLFFPFLNFFAGLLERLIKKQHSENQSLYIRKTVLALPGDALELAAKEAIHMMNQAIELNKQVLGHSHESKTGWIKNFKKLAADSGSFTESYNRIKLLEGEILEYIIEIPKTEMSENEVEQTGKLIQITRHILRSAKNIKDIRHNLEEFESTVNDHLFNLFNQLNEKVREFYKEFQLLIHNPATVNAEIISNLTRANRNHYDDAIASMLLALKENKISELDSASLLNVYREVYSSNKALVRALADLENIEAEDS